MKGEIAEKNNTFKISDVRRLLDEALDKATIDDWKKCVRHAEKLQEEDYRKECIRDVTTQNVIINLESDSSDDDFSASSESEDM